MQRLDDRIRSGIPQATEEARARFNATEWMVEVDDNCPGGFTGSCLRHCDHGVSRQENGNPEGRVQLQLGFLYHWNQHDSVLGRLLVYQRLEPGIIEKERFLLAKT